MKIVEVVWVDITYKDAGWHHFNDVEDFIKDDKENTVVQIGYIFREDKKMLYLVDSFFKDERTYGTVHKIPKGCIRSMVVVRD